MQIKMIKETEVIENELIERIVRVKSKKNTIIYLKLKEIADKEVTYDPDIGTTLGPLALSTSTRTLFTGVSESNMPGPISRS